MSEEIDNQRRLMPMALYAMLALIAALSISYATITEKTDLSASVTTVTRILIFTSSTGNMFDARSGADAGPVVRTYSDPAAIAFGAAAALLGLLAIGKALKQKNTKSVVVAVAAIGVGVWKVLQGLGIV